MSGNFWFFNVQSRYFKYFSFCVSMFFIHPNIWNEQNSRSLNSERFGEPQVSGDGPRFLTDSDTKTVTIAGGTHDN